MKKKLFLAILIITLLTGTSFAQIKDGKDLTVSSQNIEVGDILTLRFSPLNSSFQLISLSENNDNPLFEKVSETEFKAVAAGQTTFKYTSHGEICEVDENGRTCAWNYVSGASPVITVTDKISTQALCGDVNNSGKVDIVDALMVAQYYVGIIQTFVAPRGADVNNDSVINIVDALIIAQYYVGVKVTLNCGFQTEETFFVIHIAGIQCEIIYFKTALEARENLENAGIKVLSMKTTSVPVLTVCGVPNGIFYSAEIYIKDLDAAIALGWN
ncbi:MAG: dockerin type I repeat-containing protein [Spirochaetales bacterium]|nr:dockerin type I repeat-containing protein [Spirochaetales bacterium]